MHLRWSCVGFPVLAAAEATVTNTPLFGAPTRRWRPCGGQPFLGSAQKAPKTEIKSSYQPLFYASFSLVQQSTELYLPSRWTPNRALSKLSYTTPNALPRDIRVRGIKSVHTTYPWARILKPKAAITRASPTSIQTIPWTHWNNMQHTRQPTPQPTFIGKKLQNLKTRQHNTQITQGNATNTIDHSKKYNSFPHICYTEEPNQRITQKKSTQHKQNIPQHKFPTLPVSGV